MPYGKLDLPFPIHSKIRNRIEFNPNLYEGEGAYFLFPNSDGAISYFRISGQSLINENYHNSRTSDIDMKLGPVPKRYNRNKTTSKKVDDDVMSTNYDVIVIFPIYGQFGAIRKPDSGRIVCKTYIFITSNLVSYKNWKQNWKISNTALTILLGVKKKKKLTSAKLNGSWF